MSRLLSCLLVSAFHVASRPSTPTSKALTSENLTIRRLDQGHARMGSYPMYIYHQ